LINNLAEEEASQIGIDFIFDPIPRFQEEDKNFQRAIFESGSVCSGLYFDQTETDKFKPVVIREPEGLDYQRFTHEIPDILLDRLTSQGRLEPRDPSFLNASQTAGFVNLYPDPDGILRKIPILLKFNNHAYASFGLQIALKHLGANKIDFDEKNLELILQKDSVNLITIPVDEACQMLIKYAGYYKSFRYISFYDVLMKFSPAGFFKDKLVLVGASLPSLFHSRSVPLQESFPGVEVNANVVHQVINNKFISKMSSSKYFLFLVMIGLLTGILLIILRPTWSILLTVVIILSLLIASVLFLEAKSFWLPLIGPIATTLFVFASTYIFRYSFEEKDKRRIQKVFSDYVSSPVVEEILKHPEKVKLGGEKKNCTVLFSNIANFTTLSAQLNPESLVRLLNEYLSKMTDIILENGGMLDKYEGDAIMAVFGAPLEFPGQEAAACKSAFQMQKLLQKMHHTWKKRNEPEFHVRIGINSGEMIVGNMGSNKLFDYTVMGDSVNLAYRLEEANKLYDTAIMIGESTHDLVKDDILTRPLDLLRVKGKKKPVKVYELVGLKDDDVETNFKEMLNRYQKGFDSYLMRDWAMAQNHFRQALQIKTDDGPSRIHLLRCQEFLDHPPGENWDGVFVLKTK
jgi:adenylate cyclase